MENLEHAFSVSDNEPMMSFNMNVFENNTAGVVSNAWEAFDGVHTYTNGNSVTIH